MILFCADGNPEIGSGHIMRCLSIADEANSKGQGCVFITSSDDFGPLIKRKGHKFICTDSDYRKPDAENVCKLITAYRPQAVVIDSYYIDPGFLSRVLHCNQDNEGKLLYIDDLAAFSYPCDLLLNYNIYGTEMREKYDALYSGLSMPKVLLGTKYAPLRREFQHLQRREVSKNAKIILISTGGADPEHIAIDIAEKTSRYPDYSFHLLIGSLNPDMIRIRTAAKRQKNLTIHENVADMCGLMQSVDVAVSAAGSTLYELCATQTPTVTYVAADNQLSGADSFERHGVMKCAGDIRDKDRPLFIETLMTSAIEICRDYKQRKDMAEIMAEVVDGRGCMRIVDAIF